MIRAELLDQRRDHGVGDGRDGKGVEAAVGQKLWEDVPEAQAILDGVLGGRLTLTELADKLAANPARIMGLAPRKGAIAVGADADLSIFHPQSTRKVDPSAMETNCDWNPYEGQDLAGFARTTFSRGEIVVDDYKVTGNEGRGQWLPRKSSGGQDDG